MRGKYPPPHRKRRILRTILKIITYTATALLFGALMAWLIINILSGCCEGGICIPDIYPQCRTTNEGEQV